MPLPTTYRVGTVTVSANGTAVTGAGTNWLSGGIREGDIFAAKGLTATIDSVNSATSITLVQPWAGAALSGSEYEIRYTPDASRVLAASRAALEAIETTYSGNAAAITQAQLRKNNLNASRAPLPSDNETQGYAAGSRWQFQGQEWLHAGQGRWVNTVEVTPQAFGARGDGVANDTAAIQAALDWLRDQGGGVLRFPAGAYRVSASALTNTFYNEHASVAANGGCLVVWPGVSLVGAGDALIYTDDPTKTVIYQIDPNKSRITGLEISGSWTLGQNGAGHGIFTLASTAGKLADADDCEWSELTIRNVASYAIGLQNGNPTRCTLRRIRVDYTGADALDLKARGGVTEAVGNTVTDVVVTRHGNRVTGSAGIDCRGLWHLSCITVQNFGHLNTALEYAGVRFRTKPPPTDPYPAGERGSLSQFYIDCSAGTAAGAICDGVVSGSDDVTIQSGFIRRPRYGIALTGNNNGVPERNKAIGVTVTDAAQFSYYVLSGVKNASFTACNSIGALSAGWRNIGDNTSIQGKSIGDTAPISTSVGAAASEVRRLEVVGGTLAVASDLGVSMIGPATDIDLRLSPKGAGYVRFGAYAAQADAPIAGSISIRDASGSIRKLAVIA